MTPITYRVGDAIYPPESGPNMIVHVCNDLGRWGRGFVLSRSKQPEEAYNAWADSQRGFTLGQVQFVTINRETEVANLIGQHNVRRADDEADALPTLLLSTHLITALPFICHVLAMV